MPTVRRAALALAAALAVVALPACGQAGTGPGPAGDEGCDEATFVARRDEAARLHDGGAPTALVLEALLAARACRPGAYGVNFRLAQVYMELKLYAKALEALERAVAARPDDLTSRMGIVRLLVRLGRPEEVPARVDPLLEVPQWRGEGLFRKAEAFEMMGERARAWEIAEQGAALPGGQGFRCASLLGRFLLEEQRFEEAEASFRQALEGRPDHPEALKGLADALHRQGRGEEAARWDEIFSVVIALRDNVYVKADKGSDEKLALLAELVEIYPENPAAFVELAELQMTRGEPDAACATIEALARHHPDLEGIGTLRARVCDGAGGAGR